MRLSVIKAAITVAAALVVLAPSASASVPMSADRTKGEVTISVKGRGLHVETIHVTSSRQRTLEAFRVYRHTGSAATQSNVTRWKKARFHKAGMTRFAMASWRIDRKFPHGTWLCATAKKSPGNPCIQVRR